MQTPTTPDKPPDRRPRIALPQVVTQLTARPEMNLRCPTCADTYQHMEAPFTVKGEDAYKANWDGRGDLLVIPVWGECGHAWELCLGFHKGETFIFAVPRAMPPHISREPDDPPHPTPGYEPYPDLVQIERAGL